MTDIIILLFILFIAYVLFGSSKGQEPAPLGSDKRAKPASAIDPELDQSAARAAAGKKPDRQVAVENVKPAKPRTVRKANATRTAVPKAAAEQSVPERVGATAGNIWKYLEKHGSTRVAELIRELEDDEKTIQRSIGWLAQEDKIMLETVNRAETISLMTTTKS